MSQFLTSLRRFRLLVPVRIGWLEMLLFLGFCVLIRLGTNTGAVWDELCRGLSLGLTMGIVFGLPIYAAARIIHTLPLSDKGYREWLTVMPWTDRRPLPWGTPHFHWSDALFLVVAATGFAIAMLAPHPTLNSYSIAYRFVFTSIGVFAFYAITRGMFILSRAGHWCRWIMLLAVPPQMYFACRAIFGFHQALVGILVLTVVQLIAQEFALKQIIRDLSKALYACDDEQNEFGHMRKYGPQGAGFGWPFTTLSPLANTGRIISVRDGLLGALFLGMITFVFAQLRMQSGENVRAANGFLWFCTVVFVLVRFALYLPAFTSPVVRYKTGRWIIPREDRVFVAPLLALLAAGVCSALLTNQPLTLAPWVAALWSTCVPAIIFLVGPNLLDHKLTTSICMSGKSIWLAKPVESKRARRSPTVRSMTEW